MPELLEQIKHTVDLTIPDKEDFTHGKHPKMDYVFLVLRNVFVTLAALIFLFSLFLHSLYTTLKAVGYFCGAAAYIFECLAVTDCFRTKVPHAEMFMVYCFGPLYILMGLGYIFIH
ncbi:MAG: hypothetical protein J6Q42_02030 [Clostridia bacterium]|nr:hypothetical protein [Clostridia bacterium]